MISEKWRDIPGFEGRYQASSEGRVRSLDRHDRVIRHGKLVDIFYRGKVLRPGVTGGYGKVHITDKSGVQTGHWVHALVCSAFHGLRPQQHDAAHLDGDQTNNRPENLRWASRLENIRDKARHGTQPRGESIWVARLTDDAVRHIRCSPDTYRVLAQKFGVSAATVRDAKIGRTWAHVEA